MLSKVTIQFPPRYGVVSIASPKHAESSRLERGNEVTYKADGEDVGIEEDIDMGVGHVNMVP